MHTSSGEVLSANDTDADADDDGDAVRVVEMWRQMWRSRKFA